MLDAFVPLAEYLHARAPQPPLEAEIGEALAGEPHPCAETPVDEHAACDEMLAEIRRFRAALADALDARVEDLLREIAAGVLARELRLAPADVGAIAAHELALAGGPPLRLSAHPDECAALSAFACPVVADPTLLRGDLVIALRSGTIHATLGCRLERALASAAAT
jgi:flagellar biosynthesis/type III secretory pathway protein FliH